MGGNLVHDFIVGHHQILIEQILREFLSEFKVVYFPIFSHNDVVDYNRP